MRIAGKDLLLAATGGSAQANARKLPPYPRWTPFTASLLVSVATAFLINGIFAVVALSLYHQALGPDVQNVLCALVATNGECERQPTLLFFVAVVAAQVTTMLWPTHWAHDLAVRFFSTAELCDRLANEIDGAAYVDPASVQDRREWARNIVTNYKYSRLFAKMTLFGLNLLLALAIVLPWVWAVWELDFAWWGVVISASLMVPATLDVFLEMNELIWPSKGSMLLLETE